MWLEGELIRASAAGAGRPLRPPDLCPGPRQPQRASRGHQGQRSHQPGPNRCPRPRQGGSQGQRLPLLHPPSLETPKLLRGVLECVCFLLVQGGASVQGRNSSLEPIRKDMSNLTPGSLSNLTALFPGQ